MDSGPSKGPDRNQKPSTATSTSPCTSTITSFVDVDLDVDVLVHVGVFANSNGRAGGSLNGLAGSVIRKDIHLITLWNAITVPIPTPRVASFRSAVRGRPKPRLEGVVDCFSQSLYPGC